VAEKFKESGAKIAVVCGSDTSYADLAVPTVAALREAGAERVLLAGKKSDAAVDGFVHLGCPALEILNSTFDFLAIEESKGVER
jgi:methylmalonyl-CoA mutase